MDLYALRSALDHAIATGDDTALVSALQAAGWRSNEAERAAIVANVRVDEVTGCWHWTGTLDDHGYGVYHAQRAHRVSWEAFVGPIPDGLHLDHVCRVRDCVRPEAEHLEPVTKAENNRRAMAYVQQFPGEQTHNAAKRWCPKGHEYSADNTYRDSNGKRYCDTCRRNAADARRRKDGQPPRSYTELRIDERLWRECRKSLQPYEEGQPLITTAEAAKLLGYASTNAFGHWRGRHLDLLAPVKPGSKGRSALYRLDEIELLKTCQTEHHWTRKPRAYPSAASLRQVTSGRATPTQTGAEPPEPVGAGTADPASPSASRET